MTHRVERLAKIAPNLSPDAPHRDEIMGCHDAAIRSGNDGYLDPRSGLFVMTAVFLKDRGDCCDSSCRHCPFAK
ncbi:MAG: hypothetical protein ACI81L_001858 [Verrucomicrobiales bacterium]|jgi:hypothetical protein